MEHQKILYLEHDRSRTYQESGFEACVASDFKSLFSGAIIPLSLLNIHTLKLSDRLSAEELKIQVEIRMFEEGNLSSDDEYTIDFVRNTINNDDDALIEVFALSHTKARDYFADVLTKTSAIDIITPAFMVYGSLYDTLPKGNDLFIYLGEEESYGAIYQEGHYIAHRSIETLTSIAVETGLDIAKLKNHLQSKGLIEENYLPEELNKFILIQERVAKNIERLVHTINHKRGLFGLSGIDHIFLDFEGEGIPGLEAVFSAYGIADTKVIPLTLEGVSREQLHETLCASYLLHATAPLNLSPYERKAAWYARESGKFLGLSGGSVLIVLMASLMVGWMISSEETRHEELTSKLEALQHETASFSKTLKKNTSLLQEQQAKSEALQEEIALYHAAEETAVLIDDMHAKRQQFLLDTTAELGRYHLGALLMEQNSSKQMNLYVVSDYAKRDDIAKLMSGLYERGYQDVQTHEIKLDNNNTTYNSLVKVIR
ncbi:hypothetical protein [Sulfuricurvum sp.]|uniref:hypothetical protein n=1 Tax=Sulfuricurvum sp. TaxID=2025608 RepID=UPI00356612A3